MKLLFPFTVLAMVATLLAQDKLPASIPDVKQLDAMTARFRRAPLTVDTSRLSRSDKKALASLIEAARVLNGVFMEQLWSGDSALYQKLEQDQTPLGRARLHYFWMNKGPWSEVDEYKAFLPDVPARKPLGANWYPADMSKEEFEAWSKTLDPEHREQALGFFTVIRRGANRHLMTVPYNIEYKADLGQAGKLLREAAAFTDNTSLRKFLTSRADSLASNDYYKSDLAWMDLDAPIDVTFGPYETYNDELFGYKAAFEAYITLRDDAETERLAFFGQHLQQIENNLPEDPKYRAAKLGALSPIRVVNEVFASGDADHGVHTAAFNLPNDDRVVQQRGAKRVMLRNIQQAKFDATLLPISHVVLAAADWDYVSFDAFFTHIVAHELMHGLGPHQITIAGRTTNPRLELKEQYSAIEEAKADVTGLWALQFLMAQADKGEIQAPLAHGPQAERRLYTTYLASAFRTLRFGLQDAHARGMAMQMNYLLDKGGYVVRADGTFRVDFSKIKAAVEALDHDLLTVEARGDYEGAKKLLASGAMRPEVVKAIERLKSVPTDIEPLFTTADALTQKQK